MSARCIHRDSLCMVRSRLGAHGAGEPRRRAAAELDDRRPQRFQVCRRCTAVTQLHARLFPSLHDCHCRAPMLQTDAAVLLCRRIGTSLHHPQPALADTVHSGQIRRLSFLLSQYILFSLLPIFLDKPASLQVRSVRWLAATSNSPSASRCRSLRTCRWFLPRANPLWPWISPRICALGSNPGAVAVPSRLCMLWHVYARGRSAGITITFMLPCLRTLPFRKAHGLSNSLRA